MKDLCQKWNVKLIFPGVWNSLMAWPDWPWKFPDNVMSHFNVACCSKQTDHDSCRIYSKRELRHRTWGMTLILLVSITSNALLHEQTVPLSTECIQKYFSECGALNSWVAVQPMSLNARKMRSHCVCHTPLTTTCCWRWQQPVTSSLKTVSCLETVLRQFHIQNSSKHTTSCSYIVARAEPDTSLLVPIRDLHRN